MKEKHCVDYETGAITTMNNDEIYWDPVSGICKCVNCYEFDALSYQTCKPRKSNEAVNPDMARYEKCREGQIMNPTTKHCCRCNFGEGINLITQKWENCYPGQRTDPVYGNYTNCIVGEWINPTNGICEKYSSAQAIDKTTNICGVCTNGFCLDSNQHFCHECSDSKCIICSSNYNYCSFCSDDYIANNGACISSNIQVLDPTPTPKTEKIEYNREDNSNIITIDKPNGASENKNYEIEIPSYENKKNCCYSRFEQSECWIID